jgi:hypothetical protein
VNSKQFTFMLLDGSVVFTLLSRRLVFLHVSPADTSGDLGKGTGKIDY